MPRTRRVYSAEQELHVLKTMVKHENEKMSEEEFLKEIRSGTGLKALKDDVIFTLCRKMKKFAKDEYNKEVSFPKKTKAQRIKSAIGADSDLFKEWTALTDADKEKLKKQRQTARDEKKSE